jgi:hypothetical protein
MVAAQQVLAHAGLDAKLEWVLAAPGPNPRAHLLGNAGAARFTVSDLPVPEQAKAFPMPADSSRSLDHEDAGLPIVPDGAQPGPEEAIRQGQFRSLDGALQNAPLMAEREDLELKRRTAPEGSEKRDQKSGPQVPEGESKEKGQLPVYQSVSDFAGTTLVTPCIDWVHRSSSF